MSLVSIITTGGTIASLPAENGDMIAGRSGTEILTEAGAGSAQSIDSVELVDFAKIGSPAFTFQILHDLAEEVQKKIADPKICGIVVTHGTDTMEETAFFLSLVTEPTKPIVLTGAQLAANFKGSDGARNLSDAICIAKADSAANLGTVIAFSGFIHNAREVTKIDATAMQAFDSPDWGPVGRVEGEEVIIARQIRKHKRLPLKELRPVISLRLPLGFTGEELLKIAEPYEGIVLEAYGSGNAHPSVESAVKELLRKGKPVVITSRCLTGLVRAIYGNGGARDLERAGVWMGGDLSAIKARLLLSLILANDIRGDEGKSYIEDWARP
jgi:L-asparaginase